MTKNELRNKYKLLRKELSEEQIEKGSLAIANQIINLDIWEATYFHLFLSISKFKEINTECIMHVLQGRDKEIVVSKSDFKNNTMSSYLLQDGMRFSVSDYGIPEPVVDIENDKKFPNEKIDVVFVPLLAFDIKGNRVGYGKGFYDTFLTECKPNIIKIGLSFFQAEEEITDVYANDVKLDLVVTPEKIYRFI